MPFIEVKGIPEETTPEELEKIENNLVTALAGAMGVSVKHCHAFFPAELKRPRREPHMLYARVDTGFFTEAEDEVIKKATEAVGEVLYYAFNCVYSVEVFPLPLDGTNKTYLKYAA